MGHEAMHQLPRGRVIGAGHYLPGDPVSNDTLIRSKGVDSDDAWIQKRTGIACRHFAAAEETTVDLACHALQHALDSTATCDLADKAKPTSKTVTAADVDAIIVATTTPNNIFPSTASLLQHRIGARIGSMAFDVQAVCAGFVYALSIANNMIRLEQAKTVAVVGADTYSRILDWNDRSTCVLFGDGAGVLILQADNSGAGVRQTTLHNDGSLYHDLYVDGGVATESHGYVVMNGRSIFQHGVRRMAEAVSSVATAEGIGMADLDLVVPHQANQRIIDRIGVDLGLPPEKIISTVRQHANISAATIPVAISLERARFARGAQVALTALGGGLAWGGALLRW